MTTRAPRNWTISLPVITLLAALPLLAVLGALFTGGFESWEQLWQQALPSYLVNTGLLMMMVAILSSVIGISCAWFVTAFAFPGRRIFSWMLILPLAAPAYIIAYLYTDLLEFYGPVQTLIRDTLGVGQGEYWFPQIRTLPGAALMLSLVLYPYIYLLARASFSAQSNGQWQAARSLGFSPRAAFFRIALPSARPAIAGGLALVLMETLADFGVADYFAIPTFSTGIFRNWLALGDKIIALKLAGVMLLVVFLLVLLESASRKGRVAGTGKVDRGTALIKLSPLHSLAVLVCCCLPVLFGFIIPVVTLALYTLANGDQQTASSFLQYANNSVGIALIVSVVAVFIALVLAYAQRTSASAFTRINIRLATLGYALPGALLAIGVLSPLGGVDQSVTRFLKESFGWNGGLILTGTVAILVYALAIRFLTVSFNSISGGFEKVPLATDHAARSLGARRASLVGRIHFPLLRSSIAAGAMLVFIDVMRELPATLILRPFNFETLATRVYRLASDERLAEASTAALVIVLIGILPVLLLNRLGQEKSQRA